MENIALLRNVVRDRVVRYVYTQHQAAAIFSNGRPLAIAFLVSSANSSSVLPEFFLCAIFC